MPCTIERLDGHLQHCSVAKQTVFALSSGEGEFHGIVRVAACGIQTRQLLGQLGVPLRLDILCDSSAARGSAHVQVLGRVFSIKEMWMQEPFEKNESRLRRTVLAA